MKRSKRLCLLSGVLVLICLAAFCVSRYERRREEIRNSGEVILALAAEDITGLSWEYDGTDLAFHKDGKWLYDEDSAFPVSGEKMEKLLGVFSSFSASFVIENVEDYGQYGLDEPACSIRIETAGGTTYEIVLGGYSTMDELRYVSIGDGNVYLAAIDPMPTYEITLKDMILHDETPYLDQADEITFAGNEKYRIFYKEESGDTYSEEDIYFVSSEGGNLTLDTEAVESYLSTIGSLGLQDYVSYNATEEELAEYGLDEPELTVAVQYTEPGADGDAESRAFVLKVSRSAEEKARAASEEDAETKRSVPAYVRVGESQIIYEITEAEYGSLLAVSYNELRHQEIFWADFSKVTQVDVSLGGQVYTFASAEEDGETVWSYGGEAVAIDSFRTALNALTAVEFTEDGSRGREEICLTLYLKDENHPTVQLGLYRRDGESCMAVVDGVPTALVARSKVVDLVEAVNAVVLNEI